MNINKNNHDIINNLRSDIFKLIKKYSHTRNIDNYYNIYSDILGYSELLEMLDADTDDIYKRLNDSRKDNNDKCIKKHYRQIEKDFDYYQNIINKIADIVLNSNYYNGIFLDFKTRLTDEEVLSLTDDFFVNYDLNLKNRLDSLNREKRIIMKEDDGSYYSGLTICSTVIFSPYIILLNSHNIMDVSSLIHEVGHVYHYEKIQRTKYQNHYTNLYNNILETYPHYLELISYDYFQDKFNKEDILKLRKTMIKILLTNWYYIELLLDEFNKENFNINYYNYSEKLRYGLSILVAFEYYDMYLKDKEKANYYMEKYLNESGNYEFLTLIEKCGLKKEQLENAESVKKYIKNYF